MINISNLKKTYGRNTALNGLSLNVEDGMLYGLIGPNGAGKTTVIKIITGLLAPDSGDVLVDGKSVSGGDKEISRLIGYVPDEFGFYESLTVEEYMEFFASAYGITGVEARKKCHRLLEQVRLEERTETFVDALSRGMRQRLCLARALIHDPKYLILDEPMNGLDPGTRYEFKEMLRELNSDGKTILISSHILPELSQMCSDIGIIDNGKLALTGSMEDILARIEKSNPIKISVLAGTHDAMMILKKNPCVKTISITGKDILVNFEGTREDESALLASLIESEIPVREFSREPGSLENYFMQITGHVEEKIILENEE